MNIIEAKNITRSFLLGESDLIALKNVDFSAAAGEFIAITGPSGSGKSTLMNILGCLDVPTSGEYLIDGKDVSKMSRNELAAIRNQKIGFVFQKFNLLADLNALENVALPLLYAGQKEAVAAAEAEKMLETVELGDRMKHYPYQLH